MAELPNHQKGEQKTQREIDLNTPIPVDTFGGRVHVKWDNNAEVTPFGQLAFFMEFLKTSGVYSDWVDKCPMIFNSPMTSIRCDTVSTNLLGMTKLLMKMLYVELFLIISKSKMALGG